MGPRPPRRDARPRPRPCGGAARLRPQRHPAARQALHRASDQPAARPERQLWQHESFDRLVRNAAAYDRAAEYIRENPRKLAPGTFRLWEPRPQGLTRRVSHAPKRAAPGLRPPWLTRRVSPTPVGLTRRVSHAPKQAAPGLRPPRLTEPVSPTPAWLTRRVSHAPKQATPGLRPPWLTEPVSPTPVGLTRRVSHALDQPRTAHKNAADRSRSAASHEGPLTPPAAARPPRFPHWAPASARRARSRRRACRCGAPARGSSPPACRRGWSRRAAAARRRRRRGGSR